MKRWRQLHQILRILYITIFLTFDKQPMKCPSRANIKHNMLQKRWLLHIFLCCFFGFLRRTGYSLQIQCYQCEEMKQNDCSTPEYIVNCTVNVQDMCQKEVLVKPDGKSLIFVLSSHLMKAQWWPLDGWCILFLQKLSSTVNHTKSTLFGTDWNDSFCFESKSLGEFCTLAEF